jgi:sulfite reductase (ferredoxin)
VGDSPLGHRLNFVLKDLVPIGQVVPMLRKLLADFRESRQGREGFGDYCQRLGAERLMGLIDSGRPSNA